MAKQALKHFAPPSYRFGLNSGTVCGHVVLSKNTVTDPRDATCRICLKSVTKQGKLDMCAGCNDNFYNGNNPYNIKECWNLPKAQIVHCKKVGMNDTPPWKDQPVVTILNCRHEKGYVFVGAERER